MSSPTTSSDGFRWRPQGAPCAPGTAASGRSPRPALLWGAAFLALFALYLYSAYPTISPYRDSGDMAASALTLGVSHPPGYPLYLLLAHAWLILLPLGNAAFRLHALSALAGAASALVLALAVKRCRAPEEKGPAAFGAAGLFRSPPSQGPMGSLGAGAALLLLGLAPACWHLSLVSEMYSLNALVGAALLILMLPVQGTDPAESRRRVYAAAMLFGLGLGNHQTLVAALPGLLWMGRGSLTERGWRGGRFWKRRLPALIGFALLGFALYAYLPLRSAADPVLDWGEPETLRNFLRMLTRADYGGIRLHPERSAGLLDARQWLAGGVYSAKLFASELGWSGALLALWALVAGRRKPEVQGSLLAFFASGPLFIIWANLDTARPETYAIIEPHLVLPLVFAAALAGWGAADLFKKAAALRPRLGPAALAALLVAGWLPAGLAGASGRLGCRSDFTAWDYGGGLLASMPEGSLLLDPDDQTAFTLSYLQRAHGRRTDVFPLMYFRTWWGYRQLRRRRPDLLPDWEIRTGQELLGTLVSRNIKTHRIYLDLPQKAPIGYASFPMGLAYRLMSDQPTLDRQLRFYHESVRIARLLRIRHKEEQSGFFTRHTLAYWSSALNNLGIAAQALRWPDAAVQLYLRALTFTPDLAEAWNNLGNTRLSLGQLDGAEGCYRMSIRYRPSPQVMYNLGRVFLLGERFGDAEKQLRAAMDAGGPPEARNDLGLVYLRTGQAKRAVENWLILLDEHPGYYLAYYNLGLAFERVGDRERAAQAVEAFGKLASSPAEKREAAQWLRRLKK